MTKSSAKNSGAKEHAAPDPLSEYREKRDPRRTNEPFTAERKHSARATRAGKYVVHLHDATRTHYDVRLQIGGTLKSFAVPKGPSLNPADKRLAVLTEDHPLEYLDFEDVIPEGNYGAGAMIAWDIGRVRYLEGTAEEGLEKGKLDFELSGFKLHGRFALVATGRRKASGPNDPKASEWLLFKKTDAYSSAERDILTEEPRSVLSGMTVEQLAARGQLVAKLLARAEALGAPRGEVDPSGLEPMLCALSGAELDDEDRVYELKLDGVRIVADKHGKAVALRYRNGRSATASYPEISRAVAALAPDRVVLDGEIVAFDDAGRPSFQRLAPRIHAQRPLDVLRVQAEVPVSYLVFDLLALGDRDLRGLPLEARKELLLELVQGRGLIRALDHFEANGSALYEFCKAQRLEGVVAKRKGSIYRPGPRRTDDWVKIKCEREDEFVVLGWLPGKNSRQRLGALCVGSYDDGRLRYAGRAGSGLDEAAIDLFCAELEPLSRPDYPGDEAVPEDAKEARWVEPKLVVGVRYLGWTDEGRLRAPVYRGLRVDKGPEECTARPPSDVALPEPVAEPSAELPVTGLSSSRVKITNADKVFWPEEGYTKGDLCAYYATVAPLMLPFLRGRPVVLVRYPDGIRGKSFYQWNVPHGTPDWMRRLELVDLDEPGKKKTVFLVDDVDSLVYIANLGCIPLHVLACREHTRELCDFVTIDFDLNGQPFEGAVTLALELRQLLDEIGLTGFPKTSGQKGLHVLIPLGPGISFETAKLLVELLGRIVTAAHPDVGTMERRVGKRGPRIYVDTGQTGESRTIVAPYSVRAHPGATVSTPLRWEEVHAALDPSRFTLLTVPARTAEIGDPMAGFLELEPDVPGAIERLARWVK